MNTFRKQARPIDYLPIDPDKAVKEVWDYMDLDSMRKQLEFWPHAAIADYGAIYEDSDEREQLLIFFHELLRLIEAAYFYNYTESKYAEKGKDLNELIDKCNLPIRISAEQARDPIPLIAKFCQMFPLYYSRIELWELFDAVVSYGGEYFADKIDKRGLPTLYINLETLVVAAPLITRRHEPID